MTAGEPLQAAPAVFHQSFLLRARPPLALPLPGESLFPRSELLRKHQPHRPPFPGIARDLAPLVGGDARLKVIRVTHVVRAVRAAEDIDEEAHLRSSFD